MISDASSPLGRYLGPVGSASGFIQYNGEIHVNDSLLSVVLHE
jgi:hypothetical protein